MTAGYEAYSYLDQSPWPGPLAPEFGRVPGYDSGLAPEAASRAERLLAENITISLHDHPVRFPADMADTPAYNRRTEWPASRALLRGSGRT